MNKIRYTADDEEPNCGRCEHLADNFDCVRSCGAEHGWYGYERIELSHNQKMIWVITVNYWTGEVLDLEIRAVDKIVVTGNTGNGDGSVSVELQPKKSEYEECGFDKRKVIEMIKNSPWYERQVLHSIYTNKLLYKDFAQKLECGFIKKIKEKSKK